MKSPRYLGFFLLSLLLISPLFSMSLKEKFSSSSAGDYAVMKHNNTYTLIHLHSRNEKELIFEEISIASHQVDRHPMPWKEWVASKAPRHTSWILYAVDIKSSIVTECFSLNQRAHLSTQEFDPLFTTLLTLELTRLSEEARERSSRPQKAGCVQRQLWSPPQYIEGKRVSYPNYAVFTATWPCDQTKLSKKKLVFYFDQSAPSFPFPYWIQARSGAIKFKMHTVDSGRGLSSPQKKLPRRFPIFAPVITKKEGKVTLSLHAPHYYLAFELYAIDTMTSPRTTHLIPTVMTRNGEAVTLSMNCATLQSELIANHRYLFIAAPKEDQTHYAEHPNLFTWVP